MAPLLSSVRPSLWSWYNSHGPPSWNDFFYHFVLFRAVRGPDAKPRSSADADAVFGGTISERCLALWVARTNKARRQDGGPSGPVLAVPGRTADGHLTPERIKVTCQ